ncbi:MAG: hypothetical protein ACR2J3_05740 [Aridibacter sp.]
MENPNEIWQVEVNGEIYDTNFAELTNWVLENSVVESDKVRRGELRWLEAGKVPLLSEFFNAGESGIEPPFIQTSTNIGEQTVLDSDENSFFQVEQIQTFSNKVDTIRTENYISGNEFKSDTKVCSIHAGLPAKFICEACRHTFCRECPQGFGSGVKICPYCGAICKDYGETKAQIQKELKYRQDIAEGFGFNDFIKALTYPLKFKTSLIVGGIIFTIFSLAQLAISFGFVLAAAAIVCVMFANAIKFSVIANTIENFSVGKIDKNFMPNFDDFELWDDVIQPFFLSVGVYIASFGIVLAIFGGLFYNEMTKDSARENQGLSNISQEMKKAKKEGRVTKNGQIEIGDNNLTKEEEDAMNSGNMAKFQELKRKSYEDKVSSIMNAKNPENEPTDYLKGFWQMNPLLIAFGILGLLWGIFYMPAAYVVAGYTRSFKATLNLTIGFETIKILGFDYVKLVLLFILLFIFYAITQTVLNFLLSPFELPQMGNIPAQIMGNFIFFYLSAAFAVTLGFALYKNSDKLKLYRE